MSASTGYNLEGEGQPSPGPLGPELNEENDRPTATTPPDQVQPIPTLPSNTPSCPNPKCSKPLDVLDVSSQESINYSFYLVDGEPTWEEKNNWGGDHSFLCLECGFLLTTDESEALALLKDGTIPEDAKRRAASIAQEIAA